MVLLSFSAKGEEGRNRESFDKEKGNIGSVIISADPPLRPTLSSCIITDSNSSEK